MPPKAKTPPARLVLIDGTNSIYRAFFAVPALRAPDGTPTGAALGFINMLGKVIREEQPTGGSDRFPGVTGERDPLPHDPGPSPRRRVAPPERSSGACDRDQLAPLHPHEDGTLSPAPSETLPRCPR